MGFLVESLSRDMIEVIVYRLRALAIAASDRLWRWALPNRASAPRRASLN